MLGASDNPQPTTASVSSFRPLNAHSSMRGDAKPEMRRVYEKKPDKKMHLDKSITDVNPRNIWNDDYLKKCLKETKMRIYIML